MNESFESSAKYYPPGEMFRHHWGDCDQIGNVCRNHDWDKKLDASRIIKVTTKLGEWVFEANEQAYNDSWYYKRIL